MNNPHPINPLTPLAPGNKGNRNVRIAVISIVALHGVFFAGLLFQGCGPRTTESARKDTDNSFLAPTNVGYASATLLTNTAYADLTNWPGYATQYGAGTTTTGTSVVTAGGGLASSGTYSGVTGTTGTGVGADPGAGFGGGRTATGATFEPRAETVTEMIEPGAGTVSTYKIKRGDTLAKIAAAHGITTKALMDANPGVDPRKLQVDKELKLPAPKKTTPAEAAAEEGFTIYTVKKGDTLSGIARKFGVTPPEIRKANNLKSDTIMVDRKLKIPVAPKTGAAPAGGQG